MSDDECTDHDDAQTSFSKLVEDFDAKWEMRFEALSGMLKQAFPQENRDLHPKSKRQKLAGTST